MSDIISNHPAAASVTITLDSLANGSLVVSNEIDVTTGTQLDDLIEFVLDANGTPTGGKYCSAYVATSVDGTNFSDTTNVTSAKANCHPLGIIYLDDGTVRRSKAMSVLKACGSMPPKYKIVLINECGVALAASGNSCQRRPYKRQLV